MTGHTTLTPEAWARALRIEAEAPFTPQTGRLVQMVAHSRLITIQAAAGLSSTDLNRTFPDFLHSVAMLRAWPPPNGPAGRSASRAWTPSPGTCPTSESTWAP